ncbi:UTP--glucose-1-phosphate uridylyltransferase [Georgenia alba]|uniref:UTP--glucose-1-phosphate uridylyltransferase n=1 Tax=Georgenia alba TaxID=2233858 RepID=A0ABW2Q5N4_9MICO
MSANLTGRRARKAVVPVAGLGTRFAPATKAVPKEMLPVVDKPAIEYVVDEIAEAGLDDVVVVTGRGKSMIEDHFDGAPELEAALEKKGDAARLAAVRRSSSLARMHFVRQGAPLGLGHAVLQGKDHVAGEPFAVLLGDDLIDPRDPLLIDMVAVQERLGGSVVALVEVDAEDTEGCDVAVVEPVDVTVGSLADGDVVAVREIAGRPRTGAAPSNLAVVGRYVLDPAVFGVLEQTPPGRGDEIQLTDALQTLAEMDPADGGGVHGVVFRGRRYDTGDKLDYLKAVIRIAAERDDLGADLTEWLGSWVEARRITLGSTPEDRAAQTSAIP